MSATRSDALGAQALVGGKGETCDASLGVAADRGAGVGAAGRDGGVCGRGVGAGDAVAPKHTSESWEVPEGGLYPIVCTRDGKHIATLADTGDVMEAYARLIAIAPCMLAELRTCAAQFRFYEQQHRAKGTPDAGAKAETNRLFAERIEALIALAVGSAS